jgi:hypothetical protein
VDVLLVAKRTRIIVSEHCALVFVVSTFLNPQRT